MPLIVAQEEFIKNQVKTFEKLQDELKTIVREKIKQVSEANKEASKENKKIENELNIIKREIKIK